MGVPLNKLASVVQQAQSFFRMLGDDVHIDQSQGDWLGFDFDHESLNFTAEFVGAVTQDQVAAFHSAFDGTTPLRRATIAQFARIADAIEEDEVIGFGLYLNESDDPAEWRCLSRRDALRIAEEIQVLLGAGQVGQESHLPVAADVSTNARYMFGRRDRSVDTAKLTGAVREVEASLSKRISRLEGEVADHSSHIHDLRSKSFEAEQSMGRLLSAVEGFCEQAAIRLENVTAAPALASAAAAGVGRAPAENRILPEAPIKSGPASQDALTQNVLTMKDVPSTIEASPAPLHTMDAKPATEALPTIDAVAKVDAVAKLDAVAKVDALAKPDAAPKTDEIRKEEIRKDVPKRASDASSLSPVASLLTNAAASPVRTATPVMTAAPFKQHPPVIWWRSPIVILVGLGTLVVVFGILLWPTGSSTGASNPVTSAPEPVRAAPVTTPATPASAPPVKAVSVPPPAATPATRAAESKPSVPSAAASTRVELIASEPSWVSVRGSDGTTLLAGVIEPGKSQSVEIGQTAVLRAGNAGGLTVRANGKSLGPLGPHGAVRDVEFKNGDFKLVPVQ